MKEIALVHKAERDQALAVKYVPREANALRGLTLRAV
jgi:hypothetical protein